MKDFFFIFHYPRFFIVKYSFLTGIEVFWNFLFCVGGQKKKAPDFTLVSSTVVNCVNIVKSYISKPFLRVLAGSFKF